MISVIYCTRESNPKHKEHIIKTSGLYKNIEVIEIINNGESLTSAYNRGYKMASNDIVVFCHDDIVIETKNWGKKLKKHFDKEEYYGVIGVAGSKNIPKSGMWWEKPKWMYGRVKHTHNGNSWLSEYSPDLGNGVEDVINVDGLFFAVHKDRIFKDDNYTPFNEQVEGFHFYDVDFCFKNFIAGVNIGVITNIRINHMSIGQTNEEWDKNRNQFSKAYGEILPMKVEDKFKNRSINVVFFLDQNKELNINLLNQLKKNGCVPTIVSSYNTKTINLLRKNNIKYFSSDEPPNYRLGDGKTIINTPNGIHKMEENKLYRVGKIKYDLMYVEDVNLKNLCKNLYPELEFIDSAVIKLDNNPYDLKNKFVNYYNGIYDESNYKKTNPLINILTRTSNRPKAFDKNFKSVLNQTYKNIRHIVSINDDHTEKYVKEYDVDYIKIDRERIISEDQSPNPNTGDYSPHNLYFNQLIKEVKDGWVMFLDDDDYLSDNDGVERIVNLLPDEDTMAIFQMMFPNGRPLPPINILNQPPTLGTIGSPCVLFHSKWVDGINWDGWKCGDFRFIEKLYNKIPNKVTIPDVFVNVGQIGDGKKGDI